MARKLKRYRVENFPAFENQELDVVLKNGNVFHGTYDTSDTISINIKTNKGHQLSFQKDTIIEIIISE